MAASTKPSQRNNVSTDVGVVGRKTGLTISNNLKRNAEDGMEDFDAFFSPVKQLSEYAMSPSVDEVSQIRDQGPIQKNMLFGENEDEGNMSTSMDIEQNTTIQDPTEVLAQRQQSPIVLASLKNYTTAASPKVNAPSPIRRFAKSPATQMTRKSYMQSPSLVSSPVERSRHTQGTFREKAFSSTNKEGSTIQTTQISSNPPPQEEQRHEKPINPKGKKSGGLVTQRTKQRTPTPSVASSDLEDDMAAILDEETDRDLDVDVLEKPDEDDQLGEVSVAQIVPPKTLKQISRDLPTQKKPSQDMASRPVKHKRIQDVVTDKQPKAKSQKLQNLKQHLVDDAPQSNSEDERQPEPQSNVPPASLKSASRKRAYNTDDEEVLASSRGQTKQAKLNKTSSHTETQVVKPRRGRPPSTSNGASKKSEKLSKETTAVDMIERTTERLGLEVDRPAEKEEQESKKSKIKQREPRIEQSASQTQKSVSRGRPKKNIIPPTMEELVMLGTDADEPSKDDEALIDVRVTKKQNVEKGMTKHAEDEIRSGVTIKDKQPIVSIQILEEEEEEEYFENGAGARRSGRTRIAPLKFWKNERLEYEKVDDLKKTGGKAHLMKKVVRIEDTPVAQKRKRGTTAKRQVQDKQKNKNREEELELEETSDQEVGEEWEESGILVGMVRTYPQERNDVVVEEEEDVAISKKAIQPRVVLGSDYKFFKTFGRDFMGTGFIELKPMTAKKMKTSGRMQLVFYVIKGMVQAEVNGLGFRLMAGGQFQVPRGNMYQIENPFAKPAELFFAQACVVEQ